MAVHDVAARGFGDGAEKYEQARPSYADDAVAWLVEQLGIGPGATVCDLGAGTGKLTRLLVPAEASLLAVEPVEGMRAVFHRELPAVPVAAAVAEALPFADAALDAVTVAQAFHWFDPTAGLAELHRVVRPGGHLGLVWNAWDDSKRWIDRIHKVVADVGATDNWKRGHWSRDWVVGVIDAHGGYSPVTRAQFTNAQPLSRDGMVERVATTSHIASASVELQERTLAAVREILATDPDTRDLDTLDFGYVVDAFVCERK
jgi:ubiquinone/menaquinone biosynthesis C-methylase UbiE